MSVDFRVSFPNSSNTDTLGLYGRSDQPLSLRVSIWLAGNSYKLDLQIKQKHEKKHDAGMKDSRKDDLCPCWLIIYIIAYKKQWPNSESI